MKKGSKRNKHGIWVWPAKKEKGKMVIKKMGPAERKTLMITGSPRVLRIVTDAPRSKRKTYKIKTGVLTYGTHRLRFDRTTSPFEATYISFSGGSSSSIGIAPKQSLKQKIDAAIEKMQTDLALRIKEAAHNLQTMASTKHKLLADVARIDENERTAFE